MEDCCKYRNCANAALNLKLGLSWSPALKAKKDGKSSANGKLVSPCGFYCGVCKSFKKGKCQGCASNNNYWARRCKVKQCCVEKGYATCAECDTYNDVAACSKLNSPVIRFFARFVGYDRPAGINEIREYGRLAFAQKRLKADLMWVTRKKK